MKKLKFAILLSLISFCLFAQNSSEGLDLTGFSNVNGYIVTKNDDKIYVSAVKEVDDQLYYLNSENNSIEMLYNDSIKERNFDEVVYNPVAVKTESNITTHPEGIYTTSEDFKNINPSPIEKLKMTVSSDSIAYRFTDSNDKNIKKVFALSYKGNLYFNIKSLMKKFDDKSKGQAWDGGNYFLRAVEIGGYIFMEDYFTSNAAGILGGISGGLAARRIKGIIYDEKNDSFRLFRNYKEFGEFIQENFPDKYYLVEREDKPKVSEVEKVKSVLRQLRN